MLIGWLAAFAKERAYESGRWWIFPACGEVPRRWARPTPSDQAANHPPDFAAVAGACTRRRDTGSARLELVDHSNRSATRRRTSVRRARGGIPCDFILVVR